MHAFPCAVHVTLHCATPKEELKDKTRRYERMDDKRLRARLRDLEAEWDTERAFEAGAAGLVITSALLGAAHSRRWLLFSAAAGALMLERALRGWCPLQTVLKRCGVRTQAEIDAEKDAIKSILSRRAEEAQAENGSEPEPENGSEPEPENGTGYESEAAAGNQPETPPQRYPESTGE